MKGEVLLRVRCLTPEKLIERATAEGACFDTVRRLDERALLVACDAASARLLLSLCQRFGIPARVTGRRGGSAIAGFARRRRTLPLGLALAVTLCALFLSRIWRIDIGFSGETASLGNPAALTRALEALDIRPGIPRGLDAAALAQALQANAGDYSYVGVHVQGIRLWVEAVPEAPAPPVYDVNAARDLVSERDGIVVRAVARSGELCVAPGDAVRRGESLIRGEELAANDETRPIAALGEVVLRSWFEGKAELPLTETRTERTGRTSVGTTLLAMGFERPLTRAEPFPEQMIEREYLPIGGLFLPVEIERSTCRETRTSSVKADIESLKAKLAVLALADAALRLRREGPAGCEITRSWTDYEYVGGALRARAVLEIQANAAVTREALQGG